MYPTSFAYHRASSVAEAVQILGDNPEAKLLAGGYSLIPAMKLRLARPELLVDLGKIESLRGIRIDSDGAHIGAMTTYNALTEHAGLQAMFPFIADAIRYIGDQQVRAHGTLGGTLAHADPGADLTAVFLALNGEVRVTGAQGERIISADDLFVDLWTTSLEPDEIITDIFIPAPLPGTLMSYKKYGQPASGYAIAGVAAVVTVTDAMVTAARVAITGATSKATRAIGAEAALIGNPLTVDSIANAAEHAPDGLEINGDMFASEEYRKHLISVLTSSLLQSPADQ